MSPEALDAIQKTYVASNDGTIHFGQVVASLIAVGVEAYHVDYRGRRTTYYLSTGETRSFDMAAPEVEVARDFSETDMVSAIRKAQAGSVMYPEFKKLSQAAGCSSYTVWIAGRHVSYFGRKGETYVEKFPD